MVDSPLTGFHLEICANFEHLTSCEELIRAVSTVFGKMRKYSIIKKAEVTNISIQDIFRDTPLDHIRSAQICILGRSKYGQVGCP